MPWSNSSKVDAVPVVDFLRQAEVANLLGLADEVPVLAAPQLLRYLDGTVEVG